MNYVCKQCGSESLTFHCDGHWDKAAQGWVYDMFNSECYCHDCGEIVECEEIDDE